ncbi:MAG: 1-phosphofructokinase [Firmicutes bacterium]|nr:1-phosphofructokinase [Bacillota bacterium]
MIYTVTFNPSIDYFVQVENFKVGDLNRIKKEHKYPGGKGINVSRVLNNIGTESKALGFIGGFTGDYIKNYLDNEGIDSDFIKVDEDTRINIKLKSNEETEINGKGPEITKENLNKLYEKVGNLTNKDFLVLAGNVQKNLPRDIYLQIQNICKKNKVKVIVDATNETLTNTLKQCPFLIKPNIHELSDIFNTEIETKEDVIYYARKLNEMGARNVIVSMAGKGAILACDKGIYHAAAPRGNVKNSVGAGDSLIAGFLYKYSKSSEVIKSFKWGVACGSATAFSFDLCKKEDVIDLLEKINIVKLKEA